MESLLSKHHATFFLLYDMVKCERKLINISHM